MLIQEKEFTMSLFQKKTANINIEEQVMQDITDEQLTQVNGGLLDTVTDTTSKLLGGVPIPQVSLYGTISPSGIGLETTVTH